MSSEKNKMKAKFVTWSMGSSMHAGITSITGVNRSARKLSRELDSGVLHISLGPEVFDIKDFHTIIVDGVKFTRRKRASR